MVDRANSRNDTRHDESRQNQNSQDHRTSNASKGDLHKLGWIGFIVIREVHAKDAAHAPGESGGSGGGGGKGKGKGKKGKGKGKYGKGKGKGKDSKGKGKGKGPSDNAPADDPDPSWSNYMSIIILDIFINTMVHFMWQEGAFSRALLDIPPFMDR